MKPRNELVAREVTDLQAALQKRLGDTSIPTLPEVAMKIVQLVGDPNASLTDFNNVIMTDQALTGRLLRTSNTASYAQRQPVTNLRRAMVLLGLERIKAMALGFHLGQTAPQDDGGSFSTAAIWTRSIFRAWLAFRLAESFDKSKSGEAFIVGLMLDAGIPMMPRLIGSRYHDTVSASWSPHKQFAAEGKALPFTHLDIISALVEMWRFPANLSQPICLRYTEPAPVNTKNPDTLMHAVAFFVGLLELDCFDENDEPSDVVARQAFRLFRMEPDDIKRLMRDAAEDFKGSKDLFADVLDESLSAERILSMANRELNQFVEETVEASIKDEAEAKIARFDADGLILEIEPSGDHKVIVYIADEMGKRLFSEKFTPREKSPTELRRILMLEDASDELFDQVSSHIKSIAA